MICLFDSGDAVLVEVELPEGGRRMNAGIPRGFNEFQAQTVTGQWVDGVLETVTLRGPKILSPRGAAKVRFSADRHYQDRVYFNVSRPESTVPLWALEPLKEAMAKHNERTGAELAWTVPPRRRHA